MNRDARKRTPRGDALAIRVGMHFGPVVGVDDDVFGDAVNLAFRLSDLAKAGETLVFGVDGPVAAVAGAGAQPDAYTVKGKSEDIGIVELELAESEPSPPRSPTGRRSRAPSCAWCTADG